MKVKEKDDDNLRKNKEYKNNVKKIIKKDVLKNDKNNEIEEQKNKETKEKEQNKKEKNDKKDNQNIKWFIEVFVMTFILSMVFSYISTNGVSNLSLIPAILILIAVILVGIIFDIIGVAVTVANEHEFHAKATKKVKGSKDSIKLIKNAPRVANICADVIGDICRST